MHALLQQVAESGMHQPLPLNSRLAGEGETFDHQAEMGFTGRIVATVPAMLLAIVAQV